jgi:dTDP-4-dehydrorhamnose 3,5-epimerase
MAPFEETKLVRCTAGAIYDVIVDLRSDSRTRGAWQAFELSAGNRRLLYVPKGFAHGFQTLADNTEVHYQLTGRYAPSHSPRPWR